MTEVKTFDAKDFAEKYIAAMKNGGDIDKLINLPDQLEGKEQEAAALAAILEITKEQDEEFQTKYGSLLDSLRAIVDENNAEATEEVVEEKTEEVVTEEK